MSFSLVQAAANENGTCGDWLGIDQVAFRRSEKVRRNFEVDHCIVVHLVAVGGVVDHVQEALAEVEHLTLLRACQTVHVQIDGPCPSVNTRVIEILLALAVEHQFDDQFDGEVRGLQLVDQLPSTGPRHGPVGETVGREDGQVDVLLRVVAEERQRGPSVVGTGMRPELGLQRHASSLIQSVKIVELSLHAIQLLNDYASAHPWREQNEPDNPEY
jgi:hypothetical protein